MTKITSLLILLFSFFGFSQTEKLLHGKVTYQNKPLIKIDIINFRSKKTTITDNSGSFAILAQPNDTLIFMSENYLDRKIVMTEEEWTKGDLLVNLTEKPVELDEVKITTVPKIKVPAVSYADMKMAQISKEQARPRNKDVYTGEIENGIDFIQIGKQLIDLFKSKEPKAKKLVEKIIFKDYVKSHYKETFFSQTLNLKPDEINLFLEYCAIDPKANTVVEQQDELALLDFLLKKKTEFKKL